MRVIISTLLVNPIAFTHRNTELLKIIPTTIRLYERGTDINDTGSTTLFM